jgi:hypothetical protein
MKSTRPTSRPQRPFPPDAPTPGIAATVDATIYDAAQRYKDPLDARAACLQALISDIALGEQTLLVFEQDDSIVHWDRQRLIEMTRAKGPRDTTALRASPGQIRTAARGARRNRMVLGTRRPVEAANPACDLRRETGLTVTRIRETRPAHRPEGCRVHFLKLNATDSFIIPHLPRCFADIRHYPSTRRPSD